MVEMLKLVIVRGNTKLFSEMLLNNVDKHSTNFVSFGGHFVRFTANFPVGLCYYIASIDKGSIFRKWVGSLESGLKAEI